MKRVISVLLVMALLASLVACSQQGQQRASAPEPTAQETAVFKIGGIPDQDVSELNRRFGEFAIYLSEATGLQVEYVPSQDYSALVTAFRRGDIHLSWFGGLTGVQALNVVPDAEAIAQRPQDEEFHSVFIAQHDLDVSSLEDLKGLSVTFGSESSTSGHLMPRYFLMEAGIDPEQDLNGKPNYSGSHDSTWKLVESGAYQVGALNEDVWARAVEEGQVDLSKVKVFYTTPPYYDYHWTINSNVDEVFGQGTKEKVKEALLTMGEAQSQILGYFQTDKFIETKNENYAAIEEVAKQVGIIK